MFTYRNALSSAVCLIFATSGICESIQPEIKTVPIERLAKNLQTEIDKNPKDVQALLNLGRVYAMEYSLRSKEASNDPDKLKAATEYLNKAVKLHEKAIKLEPTNLEARLAYGLLLTQTERKADAVNALRGVASDAWKEERKLKSIDRHQNLMTPEAADRLIPMLDKSNDKEEIADLKNRVTRLEKLPESQGSQSTAPQGLPHRKSPIAVPLKDGLKADEIEDKKAAVPFDLGGTGVKKNWTWITPEAAWLVYDPQRTGKATSSLQLFGNRTFGLYWETGYDALSALDDNHDCELTGTELSGLALWHDANSDGICQPGEVKPLADYGIVAISCRSKRDLKHPDQIAFSPSGVTFKDGKKRPTFDLILHPAK